MFAWLKAKTPTKVSAMDNDTSQPTAPADAPTDTATPMETDEGSNNATVAPETNEPAVETEKEVPTPVLPEAVAEAEKQDNTEGKGGEENGGKKVDCDAAMTEVPGDSGESKNEGDGVEKAGKEDTKADESTKKEEEVGSGEKEGVNGNENVQEKQGESEKTVEKDREVAAENDNEKKRKREEENDTGDAGKEKEGGVEKEGEGTKEKEDGMGANEHGVAGTETAEDGDKSDDSSGGAIKIGERLEGVKGPTESKKSGRLPGKSCANCRAIRKRCDGKQKCCLRKAEFAAYYANVHAAPAPAGFGYGMPKGSVPSTTLPGGLHPSLIALSELVDDIKGKRMKKKLKEQIPVINEALVGQDVQIRQLQSYLAVQAQYVSAIAPPQGRSMLSDYQKEPPKKKRKIEVIDLEAPSRKSMPTPGFIPQPPPISTEWTYVPRPGAFIKKSKKKRKDQKRTPPSSPGSPSSPPSKTPTPQKTVSFNDLPKPSNVIRPLNVTPVPAKPKHVSTPMPKPASKPAPKPAPTRPLTHTPQFWSNVSAAEQGFKPKPPVPVPAAKPANPTPPSSAPRTKAARKMAASS